MPTTAQVNAASDTLTEAAQAQLLAYIRSSARYKSQPEFYKLPVEAIADATDVQAKQLNAALTLLDQLGDGTVGLSGGSDGVDYDQSRDREQLVSYMISVLYEQPPRRVIATTSLTNEVNF